MTEGGEVFDVDSPLVQRLIDLGMAHESPGDSGPGTVRHHETGVVYRLTEEGMDRMEDPTWRAATTIDASLAEGIEASDRAAKRIAVIEQAAAKGRLAEVESELRRLEPQHRQAQQDVDRLRRIERALKQHQDAINDGADEDTAGKIALAGLGFEDYAGPRPASEVLAKITASYTVTAKWPLYITWFNDGEELQVIAPGGGPAGGTGDFVEDMRRNPPVAQDDGEIWHDQGDGTFIAKREDGSEAIMDTSGVGRNELEAALKGDMSLEDLRAQSPAAALGLGPMIAHNKLVQASEDNPLWGKDVVDLLLAAGHLNPRKDSDEVLIQMLLDHHTELVGYDTSPAKDDVFRLTKAGADAAEEVLRKEFNLPSLPDNHVRALSITHDGTVRLVALDASDPHQLFNRVREFIGGDIEEVFCFPPKNTPLKTSGSADAVMFVDEDGLAKGLPTNVKATVMAGELGVEYADIGRGLVGDVVVISRISGSDDHEFGRELPQRFLEWSQANDAVNSIAGVKECTTTVLRRLSRNTAAAGLDYVLDPRLDPLLDPGGVHILRSLASLDHLNGLPTEPYLRCELIVKIRGVSANHAVTQHHFDVRLRDYVALRTPPGAEPVGSMKGLRQDVRSAALTADDRTPRT